MVDKLQICRDWKIDIQHLCDILWGITKPRTRLCAFYGIFQPPPFKPIVNLEVKGRKSQSVKSQISIVCKASSTAVGSPIARL